MDFFRALLSIIVINIVLSGDNAVVIAMATLRLKSKQRKLAMFWGTMGAVVLLIVFTALAAFLLKIPYVQTIGGALLLWIAVKLLQDDENSENAEAPASMGGAIKTIILADLFMSTDNVLAVAGASGGNLKLLIVGLFLSIPIVMFGSAMISALIRKWPWFLYLGAGLIGWTAGEMILKEPYASGLEASHILRYLIPAAFAIAVILIGYSKKRRPKDKKPEWQGKQVGSGRSEHVSGNGSK